MTGSDRIEQIAHREAGHHGVTKRRVRIHPIAVASTNLEALDHTAAREVIDDPERRAIGDADAFGHLAQPDIRIVGNANQDVSMVAQQSQAPARLVCHDGNRMQMQHVLRKT